MYRDEIAYTDRQLGRLLAGLEQRGLTDNTAVVFTSDHGEEFLDHDSYDHGHTLFEELVRVPLAVSPPDGKPASIRTDPVGLVDLYPTLAAFAGVQAPSGIEGLDLARVASPDRVRFLHSGLYHHNMDGVVRGRWKLIKLHGREEHFLFDRSSDESTDYAATRPEVVDELMGLLNAFEFDAYEEEPELDLDGLRSLGYVD
jgi:arylsulfatase A-like enzyme